MSTLGERIREIRAREKISQLEFSQRVCVTQSYVSRMEANKETPTDMLLKLIALEFGLSTDWLFDGKGDMYVTSKDVFDGLDRFYQAEHLSGAEKSSKGLLEVLRRINSAHTSLAVGAMFCEITNALELYMDKPYVGDAVMDEFFEIILLVREFLSSLESKNKVSEKNPYYFERFCMKEVCERLDNLTDFYSKRISRQEE